MPCRKFEASKAVPGDEATRQRPRRDETLRYVADMAGELASIAGAERLPMLTYFLNMARVEAEMQLAEIAQPSIGRAAPRA